MPFPSVLTDAAKLMLQQAMSPAPLSDIFARRRNPAIRQFPDQSAPQPTPQAPTPTAGGPAPVNPQVLQQAALLQAALLGGGAQFLPTAGSGFGVNVQPSGLFPNLNQLPQVLNPLQAALSNPLAANPAIAALFQPQNYSIGQIPTGVQGEPQWAPILQQSAIGPALAALSLLLAGAPQ